MKRSTIVSLASLIVYLSFFWIVVSSIKEKYGVESFAMGIGIIGCTGLLFFIGMNKPFNKWLGELDGEYPIETITFGDGSKYVGSLKSDAPWEGAIYDADGDCIDIIREGESVNRRTKTNKIR